MAEEVKFFELGFQVLDRPDRDAHVICIWSSQVIIVEVDLWGWYVGLYPRLSTASHLRRGSMKIVKR